jgi:hypothetical protein
VVGPAPYKKEPAKKCYDSVSCQPRSEAIADIKKVSLVNSGHLDFRNKQK